MARPKKPLEELKKRDPDWEKKILDLYEVGASDVEIKAYLYEVLDTFSCNLWNRWMEEEEEFWITIKKGRLLSNVWWEKTARQNMKCKEFNSTLWYMNMKNRFGWRDKQEIEHQGGIKVVKISDVEEQL